ncbi:hypothetical protein SAMN04489806_3334 [Paramicrobacterium humi]|uniref:Cell division protein FtsL n=1 Tax=Paramicrobacterium humi TaxID=640635 RepID=A0A1H4TWS6_9MICO|nr:hypothetical protein [Microbacterium humi]SEC60511.1 hypothetical protein SAMN04489806_3334 [Microbacterium humi]
MSTALATNARPLRSPQLPAPSRRPLRAVSPRTATRTRPRLAYAITTVAAVSAIVVAQLLLSVSLGQGAYELSSLKSEQRSLGLQQQSLNQQLQVLNSPQYVTTNAQDLGMVINQSPAYLTLSTGAVLGTPGPGGAATERPMQDNRVHNSLTGKFAPIGTDVESEDGATSGESTAQPKAPPVTFENGLPSPNTH